MPVLFKNWTTLQNLAFQHQSMVLSNVALSIWTATVQFATAIWIWESIRGSSDKLYYFKSTLSSPAFIIVPLLSAWTLFTLCDTIAFMEFLRSTDVQGYKIAIIVYLFGGVFLNVLVFWFMDSKVSLEENTTDDEATKIESSPDELEALEPVQNNDNVDKGKTTKLYFINNIKIFFTHVIVMGHMILRMFTTNPGTDIMAMKEYATIPALVVNGESNKVFGYEFTLVATEIATAVAVQAFYFWSGYFVPKSYDKKGTYLFLQERTKRLGIPFVLFTFILGPYLEFFVTGSFGQRYDNGNDDEIAYPVFVYPGPTWFLAHLLLFNFLYVIFCGENWNPSIKFPGVQSMMKLGFVMGLVVSTVTLFVPEYGVYFIAPAFFRDYLYNITFFFGGAIASRNNWIEDGLKKSMSREKRIALYFGCALIGVGVYLFTYFDIYTGEFDQVQVWTIEAENTAAYLALHFLWHSCVAGGIALVTLQLATAVFFMDYLDTSFRVITEVSSKSMYTAYIIHFLFPIQITFYLWTQLLRLLVEEFEFTSDGVATFQNSYLYILGVLFASIVVTLITWPSAYLLRSIPGFSQVL